MHAADALGRLGLVAKSVVTAALPFTLATDKSSFVRQRAALALGACAFAAPAGPAVLCSKLREDDSDLVRSSCASALAALGLDMEAVAALQEAMCEDPEACVRCSAAAALASAARGSVFFHEIMECPGCVAQGKGRQRISPDPRRIEC